MNTLKTLLNRVIILSKLPLIKSIYSSIFHKIDNKKVFTLLDKKYIAKYRLFYYWNAVRFVNSIKMESVPWTYETILENLLKYDIKWNNYKILDFWCWQHQSMYLKELYKKNIFSADIIDFKMTNFFKINPKKHNLEFENNEFDIVICSEVIEHTLSPFILIEELIRITSKKLIITTPNPMILISRKKFYKTWFLHWFWLKDHSFHKTPIFYWQIENYLKEKNIKYNRYANHSFFWLKWNDIDFWETFIYIINK